MAATTNRIRKHARNVTKDERDKQGNHKSHQVNRGMVQFVRRRPVTFSLIAAGIGLALGSFWIRRWTTVLARTKKRRLKLFFV